jgi:FixJ family two-component response regulator
MTVFLVSDDPAIRDSLSELVASAGLTAEIFASLEVWLDAVQPEREGCLLLDARARDLTGPERLARFASVCARRPVLVLIDRGDVPVAVRAIKDGAVDVLEKPLREDDLLERIKRAAATERDTRAKR